MIEIILILACSVLTGIIKYYKEALLKSERHRADLRDTIESKNTTIRVLSSATKLEQIKKLEIDWNPNIETLRN